MRFEVYGRFQLDVERENGQWRVYRLGEGKRVPADDLIIPSDVPAEEVDKFLDDLLHELASPEARIRRLP